MKKYFYPLFLFFWAVSLKAEPKVATVLSKGTSAEVVQESKKEKKISPFKHHLWVKTGVLLLFPIAFQLYLRYFSLKEQEAYLKYVMKTTHLEPYGWVGSLFILFSLAFSFLSTKMVLVKRPKWYGDATWWKENITYSLSLLVVGLLGSSVFLFDLRNYNCPEKCQLSEIRGRWGIAFGICMGVIWLVEGCIAGIQALHAQKKSKDQRRLSKESSI